MQAQAQPAVEPQLRVLVVDDNRDLADTQARLLRLLGHEAVSVYDGPSAVEAARRAHFDVVLLDLAMPGMDGYQVAAALRQLQCGPRIRILALTGSLHRPERNPLDFDGYLAKPATSANLRRALAPD